MRKELAGLLAKVNETKARASDANPLTRSEVTAALLSTDTPTISTQEHHSMVKNYSRTMTDTAELFP